jgi:predicted AlkP superfamily phosphohydrolase/phosphomutase
MDVVDSPDVGRVGPVPLYRTGGHHADGMLLAHGTGIRSVRPDARIVDLAPTLLTLLDAPIPPDFDGRPLFQG